MERKNRTQSLSFRVFMIITLLLVLPLLIAGYLLNTKISNDLYTMEKERLLIASHSAHKLLDKLGENLLGTVITNAYWEDNHTAVTNLDISWIEENVNSIIESSPNLDFIATLDLEGHVISQTGDVGEFTGQITDSALISRLQSISDFYGLMNTTEGLVMIHPLLPMMMAVHHLQEC